MAAFAQLPEETPIHWAYGAYFGTGRYEVASGESVNVLSTAPRWQIREAGYDEASGRSVGVALRLNATIGGYHFDVEDIGSALRTENVSTLSAVPGIEIEIPVTSRWSLKPLAYVGWGTDLGGDESAWIYWAGLKSQLRLPQSAVSWSLVNSLLVVGYSSNSGRREQVVPLFTGIELDHAVARWTIGGMPAQLHWRLGFTKYFKELELGPTLNALDSVRIDDEWEIGLAFSRGPEPLQLWRLRWDRIGIVLRFGTDGSYDAVGLIFRSFFDQ